MPLPDLALIDDDDLVHRVWTYVSEIKKHKLECFYNLESFLEKKLPLSTPVYIDYALKTEDNGYIILQKLHNLGYTNLFLTTGFSKETLNLDETVKIVSKDYPLS